MSESPFQHEWPQEADTEYWGLLAICRRMSWKNPRTPVRQALKRGFPLYLRTRVGQTRQVYYSTEKLISLWEWSRCEQEIERLLNMTRIRPVYQTPRSITQDFSPDRTDL